MITAIKAYIISISLNKWPKSKHESYHDDILATYLKDGSGGRQQCAAHNENYFSHITNNHLPKVGLVI